MKKIIALILAIVMVMALASCGTKTVVTDRDEEDYAAMFEYVENGDITMDTLITEDEYGTVYVRDLFTTGAIGTAESSGSLNVVCTQRNITPSVTWTLKNGVCILTGHTDSKKWGSGVTAYETSPLWNNPYIETVIVDANVITPGAWTFKNNVPNLKTVIMLGTDAQPWNQKGGLAAMGNATYPTFPDDHDINYVWLSNFRDGYRKGPNRPATAIGDDSGRFTVCYDSNAEFLTAAAKILQTATMTDDGLAVLKSQAPDLVNAVNAIGGFTSLGGNTAGQNPTPSTGYNCHDWAAKEVAEAFELGIADSWKTSDLTVNITRAQFAALAVNLWEKVTGNTASAIGDNPFTDTTDDDVHKAYNLGIINGYGDGRFGPNANITRQEAAAMLDRLATAMGTTLPGTTHPFTDGVASWASANVARVYAAGIMQGVGGTNFAPTANYTVEQTLLTLLRLNNHIAG